MEMLGDIAEIAKTSDNVLTKEEIKDYFKDMELEESHFRHIFSYLAEKKITIKGYVYTPTTTNTEEIQSESEENISDEDSRFMNVYLEEIKMVPVLDKKEEKQLYLQLMEGNEEARRKLMESYLGFVVEIAKKYKNKGIGIEDLIQEGNIGLIQGIEEICHSKAIENTREIIENAVKASMEVMLDEQLNESDWENTMVAKINLINEATKVLAEDLGRVANIHELASFTKMPEEEISDMLNLSANAIEVGECHHHSHEDKK